MSRLPLSWEPSDLLAPGNAPGDDLARLLSSAATQKFEVKRHGASDYKQHLENLRHNAQPIRHKYGPFIGLPVNNSASNFAGAAYSNDCRAVSPGSYSASNIAGFAHLVRWMPAPYKGSYDVFYERSNLLFKKSLFLIHNLVQWRGVVLSPLVARDTRRGRFPSTPA